MTEIGRLSKRDVHRMIFLTGPHGIDRSQGYEVHHDIPGEALVCHVPTAAIGHCIVKALRERQYFVRREQRRKAEERKDHEWLAQWEKNKHPLRHTDEHGGNPPAVKQAVAAHLLEGAIEVSCAVCGRAGRMAYDTCTRTDCPSGVAPIKFLQDH